jgi:Beta-lactamase
MEDLNEDVHITPGTVFHVASMSKQFTAASVVLLAQQGKLSLDDDVRKYIPELPDFGQKITLRNLVYHTSGLRDQWALLGLAGWRYSKDLITDEDVMSVMTRQKELNFKPGERHVYCNTGYPLLGLIVKRVRASPSGSELADYTGAYESDEIDSVYRIVLDVDKLRLVRLKHEADLRPAVRDVFTGEIGTVRFARDANGHVSGFVLNAGRIQTFHFTKRAN